MDVFEEKHVHVQVRGQEDASTEQSTFMLVLGSAIVAMLNTVTVVRFALHREWKWFAVVIIPIAVHVLFLIGVDARDLKANSRSNRPPVERNFLLNVFLDLLRLRTILFYLSYQMIRRTTITVDEWDSHSTQSGLDAVLTEQRHSVVDMSQMEIVLESLPLSTVLAIYSLVNKSFDFLSIALICLSLFLTSFSLVSLSDQKRYQKLTLFLSILIGLFHNLYAHSMFAVSYPGWMLALCVARISINIICLILGRESFFNDEYSTLTVLASSCAIAIGTFIPWSLIPIIVFHYENIQVLVSICVTIIPLCTTAAIGIISCTGDSSAFSDNTEYLTSFVILSVLSLLSLLCCGFIKVGIVPRK